MSGKLASPLGLAVVNTLSVVACLIGSVAPLVTILITLLAVWYWMDTGRIWRLQRDLRTIAALDPDMQPRSIEDPNAGLVLHADVLGWSTFPARLRADFEPQVQQPRQVPAAQPLYYGPDRPLEGWTVEVMQFGRVAPVRTDLVTPYADPVKSYLYYVQDEYGREVVSHTVAVEKVSEVVAEFVQHPTRKAVRLRRGSDILEDGIADRDANLSFYRVPAGEKLAKPVRHPVKEIEA